MEYHQFPFTDSVWCKTPMSVLKWPSIATDSTCGLCRPPTTIDVTLEEERQQQRKRQEVSESCGGNASYAIERMNFTPTGSQSRRGLLIAFEGPTGSGKTSHAIRLVTKLNRARGYDDLNTASYQKFPDRREPVGEVIFGYLHSKRKVDERVMHLLYSANRWEKMDDIRAKLDAGTHVILDRYAI